MKLKITLCIFLTTLFISHTQAQCNGAQFEERSGIAVIEAESPNLGNGWNRESASNPYTGNSYIAWRGADSFNNPGNGTTNYQVRINSTGTYRFVWRSKVGIIASSNPSTEHNDSWLKIQASDFFGLKNGRRIYPKGSGKSPNPEGAGGAGWFKIYSSGSTNWTWSTNTSDNQNYQVYATFNSPGVYTIQVSGRSRGHFIDRMVLYKEGSYSESSAQSLSRAQTTCGGGGGNPPPPPPPAGNPAVNSFSYINAGNNNVIGTLNNGAQINLANVPSNLSFRANANSDTGSVRIQLSGPVSSTRNDNNAPYTSFGDSGTNYTGRNMQVGNYTLTATPYAQDNLGGAQGSANTISFSIVNNGSNPPPPPPPSGNTGVTSFTLVNANNNSDIGTITQGRNFTNLPSSLSIRANTNPNSVGSVRLTLSGPVNTSKNEGAAPYYLFGDIGVNPIGRSLPNGNYTITGDPRNGSTLSINFTIGGGGGGNPPPPPPSGNDVITGFTLVNAGSNNDIGAITQGRNFNNVPSSLSIRANTNPSSVGNVRLILSGPINASKGEGSAPYYLFGDIGVNPIGRSFPNGNYTITANPRNGPALTVNFSIGGGSGKSAVTEEVYVYPNPVKNGRFSVKVPEDVVGEVQYSLISSSGAAIETGKIKVNRAGDHAEFNLDSFESKNNGVYYLILQSNLARYTVPVVKK